jgi:hypothetical protein
VEYFYLSLPSSHSSTRLTRSLTRVTGPPSPSPEHRRRHLLPPATTVDLPHRHLSDAISSPEASPGDEQRASPCLCAS